MHPILLPLAELKPALAGLGKVINRHTTVPVLASLKVERNAEGWISLTGTDLDRFISVRLEQPAKGEPLALLVPYEQLVALSKSCGKEERLQLEPGPDHTTRIKFALASQQGEAQTPPLPVGEFPAVPRLQGEAIALPDGLRRSLLEAMQCASSDDTRVILQSAFLDVSKPDAHYVVATDGRHLYSSNSFRLPLHQSLVIPKHKFLGWREFILDGNWQLKVAHDPESKTKAPPLVQISSRRWRFITRQIDGTYPHWRNVLPDPQARTRITLDPPTLDALIAVIGRMPCHDERHHSIGIEWKDRRLHLLGKQAPEDPWSRVPVPAAQGDGPDITVHTDRRLLIKALQFGLHSIGLIDELSPLRFSLGGRQMIIAPLRHDGSPSRAPHPAPAPLNGRVPCQAPPPPQPQPHDKAMPAPTPSQPPVTAPKLDDIITGIHEVRETFIKGVNQLRELSMRLKEVHRGHRSSEREMQTVRSTLLSLQRMRL